MDGEGGTVCIRLFRVARVVGHGHGQWRVTATRLSLFDHHEARPEDDILVFRAES